MIRFVECDDNIMKKIPSIVGLLYEIYGEADLSIYAGYNNEKLIFLVVGKEGCLYIDDNGYRAFSLDNNDVISFYKGKEYDVFFDDGIMTFRDKKGYVYSLSFNKLEVEEEGYTGEVIFNQYDIENDFLCQTSYHQMYNAFDGKVPIYSYHTKEPSGVYLEAGRSKKKFKYGLIPSSIQSYNRFSFDRDTLGYKTMLIHDYGLVRFLSSNSYDLERTGKIQKYIKCRFMLGDKFYDGWPFPSIHDKDEVFDIVKQYGFMVSIPDEMIEYYNGYNYDLNNIIEIIEEFKKYKKKKECGIELTLKKDD